MTKSATKPDITNVALIVAAGRGHRFGGSLPKQYRDLCGQNILTRTLRVFLDHPEIQRVAVVIHMDDLALYREAVKGLEGAGATLAPPVEGGARRQDSVRLGIESLEDLSPKNVLIHDAARPFISRETISDVIAALQSSAGAIAAVPVTDTLKHAEENVINKTVERAGLWRAQTPQAFDFMEILAAHRAVAQGGELTDDAAVAENAGMGVALVPGDEDNFKITSEDDLKRGERLLMKEGTQMAATSETRVGSGFDVHAFVPLAEGESGVLLCGVAVPHDQALSGHSDADVGLHALTDAILGALGEGDIGDHFPPSNEKWKGAASSIFLEHAGDLVTKKGGRIVHLDLTFICEAPKIGPMRDAMRSKVAQILGLSIDRVSIKATTSEKMGFTGRGEGIAAQGTATLILPTNA